MFQQSQTLIHIPTLLPESWWIFLTCAKESFPFLCTASVGRPEVPKWQEEIKLEVAEIFFFSLFFLIYLLMCCNGDTWFCLNLTSSQTLS